MMRSRAVTCVALLACLQACRCGKERVSPPDAHVAEPEPPPPDPAKSAVLVGSKGVVELQRGGGTWSPATTGTRVTVSDALRTPADGEAELSVDGVRVKLHDRSELRLTAASSGLLRGRVRGRIESDVESGKGKISLQVEDGDTVATSSGGHFVVTAEGGRAAVVAATKGSVEVASAGKTVQVLKGQVARVESSGKLTKPTAAFRRVLLAVEWPGDKTNRSSIPLSGRVAAGSRVYVQGQPVEVAPSGEFRAEVKLHDGKQKIAVVTVDPFGRRKSDEADITRDQSIPGVRIDSPWKR